LSRAYGFAGFLGIAHEDQRTAGSPRNTCRVVRPDDLDAVSETRHTAVAGAEAESANTAESGGDILVRLHVRTIDESHNHIAHAGFDLYGDFREAKHDLVAAGGSFAIHESLIRGSANGLPKHDLAVDHDD